MMMMPLSLPELLGTFVKNNAYKTIESDLIDFHIKDTVTKRITDRIRQQMTEDLYEKSARAYYAKWGTSGEF